MRRRPVFGWTAAAVCVVVAFLLFGLVARTLSPTPSGPALSSYATTPAGTAAWAELLNQDGHPVRQLRKAVTTASLPADATLVILASSADLKAYLTESEASTEGSARAIQRFLNRGGRLVLGDQAAGLAAAFHGAVIALPDPTFLENRALATGDNALRAIDVAGARQRPVYFDEAVHGYGPAIGLAALPDRWWFAIAAFSLALVAWALSRAVRLGGADPLSPVPPSPRAAYIEAMAETLRRAAKRDELLRDYRAAIDRGAEPPRDL